MLHRTAKIIGFHLQASDGEIGHIDDLLFDERDWTVRYLVVDTSNWVGGKSVLVSTAVVTSIDPIEQRVTISLTQDQVKAGPEMESADIPTAETQRTIWIM